MSIAIHRYANLLISAIAIFFGSLVGPVFAQVKEVQPKQPGQTNLARPHKPTREIAYERDHGWFRARILPDGVAKPRSELGHIDLGDPITANLHYDDAAKALGLSGKEEIGRLDQLLAVAGYKEISAKHLAELDSIILMDPAMLQEAIEGSKSNPPTIQQGDILATRFFSPKTTDVSGVGNKPREYSWRKLIRLRVQPGSQAEKRGFTKLWVLTNTYEADLTKNPFLTPSRNFQAILQSDLKGENPHPNFFFVFDPLPHAARAVASKASWDGGNENLGNDNSDSAYHPPTSCIQCHGRDTKFARLQYLDTDHWIDRVQMKDDFGLVGQSQWPALFDAGMQADTAQYAGAFEVVRQLNREILAQNQATDEIARREAVKSNLSDAQKRATDFALEARFQTRATANWLQLHEISSSHIPPAQRGILGEDGVTRWNPTNRDEESLVKLLNQFCFRCHSSVRYHVFDKQAIKEKYASFAMFLDTSLSHGDNRMPQDRRVDDLIFTSKKREEISALAERIFERPIAAEVLRKAIASSTGGGE